MLDIHVETPPEMPRDSIDIKQDNFGSHHRARNIVFGDSEIIIKRDERPVLQNEDRRRERELSNARVAQKQYNRYRTVFGDNAVAKTLVVIGQYNQKENRSGGMLACRIYQEKMTLLVDAANLTPEEVRVLYVERFDELTSKRFDELDSNNSLEFKLKSFIQKYNVGLARYYEACIEALLCGVVPDLQFNYKDGGVIGYLFNKNIGVDSKGEVKLFDFTDPTWTCFEMESTLQESIRVAIDDHKKNGEYPVSMLNEGRTVKWSDWYIGLFSQYPKQLDLIKQGLSSDNDGFLFELESLRKLSALPEYGSSAINS